MTSLAPPHRRRWLIVAALVTASALAIGVGASEDPRPAPTAAAAPPRDAARLDEGPRAASGDLRWQRARPAASASLVDVRGRVIDRLTGAPVPEVDVVFADGTSEASTLTDDAGRYSLTVPAGRYRAFVEGAGVVSTAPPTSERLPARPDPVEVAVPRLDLAPALDLRASVDGLDLEVELAGTIRGRVVDPAGAPIAGALVRASTIDGGRASRPVRGSDVAETDSAGGFELEVAAASYRLEAFHDHYGGVGTSTTVTVAPRSVVDAELTMHAGCVISGRVVRANGQPVAGGALERSGSDDEASASFVAAGTLAADGAFVWSTADAMSVLLRAWPWRSPPSAARRFECTDGARFTDVVFVIPDAAPDLSGRVVTTDGRPVPFAFVDIRGEADVLPSQQERADADGAWAVYALPPGRYRVSSSADDGGAAIARVTAPADAVDLRLSGTGALEGEVAGLGDGPLTLTVVLYAQAADEIAVDLRRAVTVTRGRYRVDGLPAGELVLQFEQGERRTFLETEVAAGRTTSLDVDLRDTLAAATAVADE